MRRLRIAVYHNLGPGGALRALAEMVKRSSDRHDFDLYETSAARDARTHGGMAIGLEGSCLEHQVFDLPPMPLPKVKVGFAHPLRQMWQLERVEAEIARKINTGGYDLAFVHPCHIRYTPAILSRLRVPVVYFMQEPRRFTFEYRARSRRRASWRVGPDPVSVAFNAVTGELSEPVLAYRDRVAARTEGVYVLCNSVSSRERILAAYGIDAHLCYLGVDPDTFRPGPERTVPPSSERQVVLSVGRFSPVKRHDLVVEALATIPADRRPQLVVVGEGVGTPYEAGVRELAAQRGVDADVRVAIDDHSLVECYREATAVVCASELEPFGLTALEAIACGTPVVAVREGGYRESVVDGVTGVLVDPDVRGVAGGIVEVAEHPQRFPADALHASIAAGGWTWEACVERLEWHFVMALEGQR